MRGGERDEGDYAGPGEQVAEPAEGAGSREDSSLGGGADQSSVAGQIGVARQGEKAACDHRHAASYLAGEGAAAEA